MTSTLTASPQLSTVCRTEHNAPSKAQPRAVSHSQSHVPHVPNMSPVPSKAARAQCCLSHPGIPLFVGTSSQAIVSECIACHFGHHTFAVLLCIYLHRDDDPKCHHAAREPPIVFDPRQRTYEITYESQTSLQLGDRRFDGVLEILWNMNRIARLVRATRGAARDATWRVPAGYGGGAGGR